MTVQEFRPWEAWLPPRPAPDGEPHPLPEPAPPAHDAVAVAAPTGPRDVDYAQHYADPAQDAGDKQRDAHAAAIAAQLERGMMSIGAPEANPLTGTSNQVSLVQGSHYNFINELDKIDDPALRAAVDAKFEAQTGQSLEQFITNAKWAGTKDRDAALALISPGRAAAEINIAVMSPEKQKELHAEASEWAEQILTVTRKEGADDDANAETIFRTLGPRTPEEIEAIRAAIRENTHGDASVYEELDRSLRGKHADEAVADLSGDPEQNAMTALATETKPERLKEVVRELGPARLAEMESRYSTFGLFDANAIAEKVPGGADRAELRALLAGDKAGADAAEIGDLLVKKEDCYGWDQERRAKEIEKQKPENVIKALEGKSPDELRAARESWDQQALAKAGGDPSKAQTFDEMIEERYKNGDTTQYLRLKALVSGDKAMDKAYELEHALTTNDQKAIEDALTDPDLESDDPAKRAAAQRQRAALEKDADRIQLNQVQRINDMTGASVPVEHRTLEQQLEAHYQGELDHVTGDDMFAKMARAHLEPELHDDRIAALELAQGGRLTTATEFYRAQEEDGRGHEADELDAVKGNIELTQVEADYAVKYGKTMLADEAPDDFERTQAAMKKSQGDSRSEEEIAADIHRAHMDATGLRIDNIRHYGAKDARDAGMEYDLARELYDKEYSGALDDEEEGREYGGGNAGTVGLAREQLETLDDKLGDGQGPLGFGPRALKDGESRDEFGQVDANLGETLHSEEEEKEKLGEKWAKTIEIITSVVSIVTLNPELALLVDVAGGLAKMAVKQHVEGEAYDATKDVEMLGITTLADLASAGIGKLGTAATATADAAKAGEETAGKIAAAASAGAGASDAKALEQATTELEKAGATPKDAGVRISASEEVAPAARPAESSHGADVAGPEDEATIEAAQAEGERRQAIEDATHARAEPREDEVLEEAQAEGERRQAIEDEAAKKGEAPDYGPTEEERAAEEAKEAADAAAEKRQKRYDTAGEIVKDGVETVGDDEVEGQDGADTALDLVLSTMAIAMPGALGAATKASGGGRIATNVVETGTELSLNVAKDPDATWYERAIDIGGKKVSEALEDRGGEHEHAPQVAAPAAAGAAGSTPPAYASGYHDRIEAATPTGAHRHEEAHD